MKTTRQVRVLFVALSAALILLAAASVFWGRYGISPEELLAVLKSWFTGTAPANKSAYAVLIAVRIPRIVCAILIGAALSAAGAAYQGIFRNPMVSPDILGASAGAGFGAALGFLLGLNSTAFWALSFFSGLAAVGIACAMNGMVSRHWQGDKMVFMLCGVVTGSLFQALIGLVKYAADPFDTMPSISFWLMGGLTYITAADVPRLALVTLGGMIPLILLRWRINVLSLGGDEARSLGLRTGFMKAAVVLCATLMTAGCVAVSGMVGWVGLVIPHIARMLAGADFRRLLPCSALLGALFLLAVDNVARGAFAQELPIGILTALIGAPVFIKLLAGGQRELGSE